MTKIEQHLILGTLAVLGIIVALSGSSYLTSAATKYQQVASLPLAPVTKPAPPTTEQQQAIDASTIAPAAGSSAPETHAQ